MNVTTESRQSEETPGENEAKFRLLFENSPDAMLLLDGDAFVDCNQAAVEMMRCAGKEQLLALRPYDISPAKQPDGRLSSEKARDLIATAFREGNLRFEWVHRAVDGTDFPVEVLLTAIPLRGRKVLHVAWRDITERKRTEEVAGDVPVIALAPDPALGRRLNLLELLFDRMPMGVAVFDREYCIQRYNSTWEDFAERYAPPSAVPLAPGVYYFDLLPGSEPTVIPLFERVLTGETIRLNGVRLESGGVVTYWDMVLALLIEDGEVAGILNVTVDATERVESRRNLEQRVKERTREIERRRQVAEGLRDVLKVLNSNRPLDEILDYIIAQACRLLGANAGVIYRLEVGEGLVIVEATCNMPADFTTIGPLPLTETEPNRAVLNRQPFAVSDFAERLKNVYSDDPELPPRLEKWATVVGEHFCAYLSVPLIVRDKVYGTVSLYYHEPREFSAEEIELAVSLSDQAALAIENARLHQAEQNRQRELQTLLEISRNMASTLELEPLLGLILDQLKSVVDYSGATILALEEDNLTVLAYRGPILQREALQLRFPLERASVNREVIRRRELVIIPDVRDDTSLARVFQEMAGERLETAFGYIRSWVGVPLIVKNQVVGMLTLDHDEPNYYSPRQAELALAFANHAAAAIENARLYQAEQNRQRELQTLLDVAAAASSSLELDEMLSAALNRLVSLVGASRAGVMLPDGESGELEPRMIRPERLIVLDDLAEMAQACRAVLAGGEPLYVPVDAALGHLEPGALLPLRVRGQALGVLVIIGPQGSAFSEGHLALFESIADQLGVAVENARLYEQTERAAVAAERSRLARDLHDAVTQTLFSASLISEVLPRIWERDPEEGRRRLDELRELTRGALAEMRTLLLELRPSALVDAALNDLLRQLAESITGRARVPVAVEVEGKCTLSPEVKVALYRIAQEALNNVAKHAGASQATVSLRCPPLLSPLGGGKVELHISDDGCGFDPQSIPSDSLGLGIMRERAEAIGAVLGIDSEIGRGTQVVVVWKDTEGEKQL